MNGNKQSDNGGGGIQMPPLGRPKGDNHKAFPRHAGSATNLMHTLFSLHLFKESAGRFITQV